MLWLIAYQRPSCSTICARRQGVRTGLLVLGSGYSVLGSGVRLLWKPGFNFCGVWGQEIGVWGLRSGDGVRWSGIGGWAPPLSSAVPPPARCNTTPNLILAATCCPVTHHTHPHLALCPGSTSTLSSLISVSHLTDVVREAASLRSRMSKTCGL